MSHSIFFYVIEGTPKESSQMPGGKIIFSFSKKTGFVLKMVTNGPDDKPMMTMTITDIKTNQPISPDRFKFKVPDGVQVIDRTKKP